jgi:hypothetical protein
MEPTKNGKILETLVTVKTPIANQEGQYRNNPAME